MSSNMLRASLLAVLTCAGAAVSAQAQQFDRIVGFGDSLTDQGNVATAFGGAVPNYLPLRLQQFSNGPTWITQLFGPSTNFFTTVNPNTGNVNFAFGGAQTAAGTATQPVSIQTQINTYLARGGRFGTSDVVSLWGGANNIFDLTNQVAIGDIPVAAAPGAAVTVTNTAAVDIGNQVRQLSAAGARTLLVFNLPDFASLPAYNTVAANAQLAGLASGNFNQALLAQLTGAAAALPNTNIISVPIDQIFRAIIANPASFGFTNVTQACLLTPSCAASPAQFNNFLFFDTVHPTERGHSLIAATVQQYLQAPTIAAIADQVLSDTSFALRRSAALGAVDQLGRVVPANGQWQFFIYGTGDAGSSNSRSANGILTAAGTISTPLNDYTTGGVRLGGLRNIGDGITLGASFYFTTGEVVGGNRLADGNRQIKLNATQIGGDILARWDIGRGSFVNFGGGASFDRYNDYERRTLGPLVNEANPTGYSASVLGELGHDFKFDKLTVTPKGRFQYLRTTVDSFTETGVVAAVSLNSRVVDALAGAFELRAAYAFNDQATLRALIGYEDYLTGSAGSVTGRLTNNTAQAFSVQIANPVGVGVVYGGGFDWSFGTIVARADYRGSTGDRGQTRHQGSLGASFKF